MSYILGYPSNYTTPSQVGKVYKLLNVGPYQEYFSEFYGNFSNGAAIVVRNKNGIFSYYINYKGEVQGDNTFIIAEGNNEVNYEFYRIQKTPGAGPDGSELTTYKYESSTFTIYGVENRLPLSPYTVEDVINRVLQLVEPITNVETPRFSFTIPDGKEKLFNQFAPEFTFTRCTLREALQQIGGFIHAEPRLTHDNEIVWDFYGEEERATYKNFKTREKKNLSEYKYRTLQRKRNLDETANALDSYQQNLVNRLNSEDATTATPFDGGFQTLRMETAWAPTAEENSWHIETAEPIDRIVKVEVALGDGEPRNITPYIYEKKVYDNLSGISETYPNAKVTSIYYTHGQKGIYGLFYRNPDAFQDYIGSNYAIENIYKYVSGENIKTGGFKDLRFCVTYVPIYSTRVQQVKQHVQDFLPMPRTINYTQSANSVETQYFGEHIKGAIARMGNAEKNITMNFRNYDNIPKVGLLFDEDYYISECSVSVLQDHFEVTLGLSKNFNRKSKYIGASSIKRIYEVSEEQVQERHTVLQDYIVISTPDNTLVAEEEKIAGYNKGSFYSDGAELALWSVFVGLIEEEAADEYNAVAVVARGYTKNGTKQERVILPVVASAFGNTIEFTWKYKDNFSAGFRIEWPDNETIERPFNVETEYTDYYGRLYSYDFDICTKYKVSTDSGKDAVNDANNLPRYDKNIVGDRIVEGNDLLIRKDGREALKYTYALNFVADDKRFVIGHGLTLKNPMISTDRKTETLKLVVFKKGKLNRFNAGDVLAGRNNTDYEIIEIDNDNRELFPSPGDTMFISGAGVNARVDGTAWAYILEGESKTKIYEDEDGKQREITTQDRVLIFGKNVEFKAGDKVGDFIMFPVHDIYKYRADLKAKII